MAHGSDSAMVAITPGPGRTDWLAAGLHRRCLLDLLTLRNTLLGARLVGQSHGALGRHDP